MSRFARVPPAAASTGNLHARELRVLIAICMSADQNGRAWPGVTEIGRRTGIARGKVPELVKRLEAAGLISVERRPGRDNIYTINYSVEVSPPTGTLSVPAHGDTDTPQVSPPEGTGAVPEHGDCPRPRVSPPTGESVPVQGEGVSPPTGTKHLNSSPEHHEHSLPLMAPEAPQVVEHEAAPQSERADLPTMIFAIGRPWLVQASGKSDSAARKVLGKWRRDHGDAKVMEVLLAAREASPSEPVAWCEAAFKARAGARGRFDPPPFRVGDTL